MLNPFKQKEEAVPFGPQEDTSYPSRLTCIGIAVIVMACVAILAITLVKPLFSASDTLVVPNAATQAQEAQEASDAQAQPGAQKTVYVHLLGCVVNPGVYQCAEGSRLADVVELAGGLSQDAAPQSINLAALVTDGSQVTVLSQQEFAQQHAALQADDAASSDQSYDGGGVTSGKVNINTASAAELQTLNGVGQATAAKIISYRQKNGPFSSVDDLVNVSGIGEKRLEALRDFVTV